MGDSVNCPRDGLAFIVPLSSVCRLPGDNGCTTTFLVNQLDLYTLFQRLEMTAFT